MIIGYGRHPGRPDPATIDQLRQDLMAAGAETVFVDTDPLWLSSGSAMPASGLDAAMAATQPGDTLLSLSPALLAGSMTDLITIAGKLTAKGAYLKVQQLVGGQTLDTATPAGAMLLGALGLMAAFDRPAEPAHYMPAMARTLQPIENFAPRRPRGRPPTATTQATEITRLRAAGMRATDIAERLKICRASVYRVLNLTHLPAPSAEPAVADNAISMAADRVATRVPASVTGD